MKYSWNFIFSWPLLYVSAVFFRLLAPFFRPVRKAGKYPWVIGGHRGRLHEDNAGTLHTYIAMHTNQRIIWITANAPLASKLRAKGYRVLMKNSIAARLAILRAPVLIYSHGEDDLDLFMNRFRNCLGIRVFLNHCLRHLKTGQFDRPCIAQWSQKKRDDYLFHVTDFDVVLTTTAAEKAHFDRAYPHKTDRILPYGGGAHVDGMLRSREMPVEPILVWFPTYRDEPALGANAKQVIETVLQNPRLHAYLEKENLHLAVIGHVNLGTDMLESSPHPRISFQKPDTVLPSLGKAACLITDFSGLTIDWMCFDRPIIHFPFDEIEYLKTRRLCNSLQDLQYGPLIHTPEEFLQVLETNAWRNKEPYEENRKRWMKIIFPSLIPNYSENCYETILEVKKNFREKDRSLNLESHHDA